jgi:hypothetical protein
MDCRVKLGKDGERCVSIQSGNAPVQDFYYGDDFGFACLAGFEYA